MTSPSLTLLPAVDVADGKAVRLTQGAAGSETSYGDPIDAANEWVEQGAEWIHLVDLDAAFGRGNNYDLIKRVVANTPGSVNIELSGGIRDDASLAAALATGCRRVNLGTAALEDPEWADAVIRSHGDRIAVGLDVRGTTLAARGWTREGGNLWEVLDRLETAGCSRYVVTDVNKDGMLNGPNLELLRSMCEHTDKPVIASGGVSSLQDLVDIRTLVPLGVEGAIVGKALYAGAFTLPDALIAARD
jgi:1-(5-phosphoribosyl)-5-[(5-phosphoribosylamino)methylideneamino] imidazole-4-carboxamide isomerase/N-(5'phosphoribosyl)anthranilate isomerase